MPRPGTGRPPIPDGKEYGSGKRDPLSWETVRQLLANAHYYWLSTTRPDGRPHAVPMWAVWLQERLFFTTDTSTVTARNLEASALALAHLADPREVVILEGEATRLGREAPGEVTDEFDVKYGWRLDPDDAGASFYVLVPRSALAWHADDIRGTAARWRF